MELWTNQAVTQLQFAITNTDNALTVLDANPFPHTGFFRIRIDDEILGVNIVSSNVFQVARAIEPVAGITSATSHAAGAIVRQILTAAALASFSTGTAVALAFFPDGFFP